MLIPLLAAADPCFDLLPSLVGLRAQSRDPGRKIFFSQHDPIHKQLPFLAAGETCGAACVINVEQIVLNALGRPLITDMDSELRELQKIADARGLGPLGEGLPPHSLPDLLSTRLAAHGIKLRQDALILGRGLGSVEEPGLRLKLSPEIAMGDFHVEEGTLHVLELRLFDRKTGRELGKHYAVQASEPGEHDGRITFRLLDGNFPDTEITVEMKAGKSGDGLPTVHLVGPDFYPLAHVRSIDVIRVVKP